VTYRCRGYAAYDGHCGALDCETCHPGGARAMAFEEATADLRAELAEAEDRLASAQAEVERIEEAIRSIASEFNRPDDDSYDDLPPPEDDRELHEVDWESPE